MGKFYPAFQNQGVTHLFHFLCSQKLPKFQQLILTCKSSAGSRGARSAPNSAGKPKPEQENPFKVRMNDFPQLAGPTAHPQTPQTSSPWQVSAVG